MLPQLASAPALATAYASFLDELRAGGFTGDIQSDYASRLINATDNSVYQILPQSVVAPKSQADVALLARLSAEPRFRGITLSPRGGGTGTNGQSLSDGLIVDLSRHLNRILELNLKEGWVRVQPGVVLDQVNDYLRPHGVFFAPSVSPSSRATLGGMIATDACGKGSRVYGKTSGHIVELSLVFTDGTTWVSSEMPDASLAQEKLRNDRLGEALRVVDDIVTNKQALIEKQFPKIPRFLTGYNLAHVRKKDALFCLNPLLAGSEGTLTFVTEAKLRVMPIAAHKALVVIHYPTFDAALSSAQLLVSTDPSAIETIDDTILNLARQDTIWQSVAHLVDGKGGTAIAAINLVEFSGSDLSLVSQKVDELTQTLERNLGKPNQATGYLISPSAADSSALWDLRKKGVGLLGNAPGSRRPIAFVEDTAVHPEKLADYIREFRVILDEHGLKYGMFGHVDVGCLHVRPALNMRDLKDEKLLREISDKVVELVKRYGGVMWSEHGKGFRSEYSPRFFGQELYEDLRRVKRAFDPYNQLNPGKLATPSDSNAKLVSVDALKRGSFDRQITSENLAHYSTTINCNGNGACFDYAADSVMCPSSKVTRNRVHSPKGRATMMREWLRQLSSLDYNTSAEVKNSGPTRPRRPALDAMVGSPGYDFSHEVYAAMDGCLACKACATQCPVKVDVPQFKSEFLELYHRRYRRPLKDHFAAALESLVLFMAWLPWLVNLMLSWKWVGRITASVVGIVDAPTLSSSSLKAGLRRRGARRFSFDQLSTLSADAQEKSVILVQDAFHSYFDVPVTLATYDLLTRLGQDVYVLPYRPSGKALHVKGFLSRFQRVVRTNTEFYRRVATLKIPMVGIDPAVTLAYRDEYPHALGEPTGFEILLLQEWLDKHARPQSLATSGDAGFTLMGHCTERTAAPATQRAWQRVFEKFGLKLSLKNVGCCGMCGMYGHEASHVEESRGIFDMSWKKHLPQAENNLGQYLAPGYSCRTQVKRFRDDGAAIHHPVIALLAALTAADKS